MANLHFNNKQKFFYHNKNVAAFWYNNVKKSTGDHSGKFTLNVGKLSLQNFSITKINDFQKIYELLLDYQHCIYRYYLKMYFCHRAFSQAKITNAKLPKLKPVLTIFQQLHRTL